MRNGSNLFSLLKAREVNILIASFVVAIFAATLASSTLAATPPSMACNSQFSTGIATAKHEIALGPTTLSRRVWMDVEAGHLSEDHLVDIGVEFRDEHNGGLQFAHFGRPIFRKEGGTPTGRFTFFVPAYVRSGFAVLKSRGGQAFTVKAQFSCSEKLDEGIVAPWAENDIKELLQTYRVGTSWSDEQVDEVGLQLKLWATGAKSPEDIAEAFRIMLLWKQDFHSNFLASSEIKKFYSSFDSQPFQHEIQHSIGMLRFRSSSFADREAANAYAGSIAKAVQGMRNQGIQRFLIDLSAMSGGDMWPVLTGLDGILDGPLVGHFAENGRFSPWIVGHSSAWLGPGRPVISTTSGRATSPTYPVFRVAVVVGPRTQSAGEAIAVAFLGQANATLFGEPTAGYTNNVIRTSTVGNGRYLVGVVVGLNADRHRKIHSGPIQPHHFAQGTLAFEEAIDWLIDKATVRQR